MVASPLFDIGLIIIVSTFFAYLARILRQPFLVAYVLAGFVIGPSGLGLITNTSEIATLSELGIAFLLFTVGLEIDLRKLKHVGFISIGGGILQVILTFITGFFVAQWIGFDLFPSIYMGLLTAFSSTMIVTKLLVDRYEINTLHGRIMLGVLLIQDLIIITILPILTNTATSISMEFLGTVLIKGLGLFSIAVVLNKYVLPRILDYAAKSYEILFMTAISICFFFIGFSYALGFSIAIGAFIGGIALANFPYNLEIEGEIHSLRDFFSLIFFTTLGIQLNLHIIGKMFWEFFALIFLVILIKPIILSLIYLFSGYGGRTSTLVGIGLGQASEFSFIMALEGYLRGHITADIYSLMITVVVISMVITPYLMSYRNGIYSFFTSLPISRLRNKILPRKVHRIEKHPKKPLENHIIIFGSDRMGRKIVEFLKNKGEKFIVIDHNPDIIKNLGNAGVYCIYGDAENDEILKKSGLYKARLAVLTIPNTEIAGFVISKAKRFNPRIKIFARAHSLGESRDLYRCGADYVVVPEFVSGEKLIGKVKGFLERKK